MNSSFTYMLHLSCSYVYMCTYVAMVYRSNNVSSLSFLRLATTVPAVAVAVAPARQLCSHSPVVPFSCSHHHHLPIILPPSTFNSTSRRHHHNRPHHHHFVCANYILRLPHLNMVVSITSLSSSPSKFLLWWRSKYSLLKQKVKGRELTNSTLEFYL